MIREKRLHRPARLFSRFYFTIDPEIETEFLSDTSIVQSAGCVAPLHGNAETRVECSLCTRGENKCCLFYPRDRLIINFFQLFPRRASSRFLLRSYAIYIPRDNYLTVLCTFLKNETNAQVRYTNFHLVP